MRNPICVLHASNLWLHPHTYLHLLAKIQICQYAVEQNKYLMVPSIYPHYISFSFLIQWEKYEAISPALYRYFTSAFSSRTFHISNYRILPNTMTSPLVPFADKLLNNYNLDAQKSPVFRLTTTSVCRCGKINGRVIYRPLYTQFPALFSHTARPNIAIADCWKDGERVLPLDQHLTKTCSGHKMLESGGCGWYYLSQKHIVQAL
jgi:hypothetical protein